MNNRHDSPNPWKLFYPFRQQSHITHVIVVMGGAIVWSVSFIIALSIITDLASVTANTDAMRANRRWAAAIAGVPVGFYFGIATVHGYGGPVLNFIYPGLFAGPLARVVVGFLFGPVVGVFYSNPRDLSLAVIVVPHMIVYFVVVVLITNVLWSKEDLETWIQTHHPAPPQQIDSDQ